MDPESYFSASTKPRIISSSFVYKLTVFYFEVFKCRSECFEVILGFHLIFLMLPVFYISCLHSPVCQSWRINEK